MSVLNAKDIQDISRKRRSEGEHRRWWKWFRVWSASRPYFRQEGRREETTALSAAMVVQNRRDYAEGLHVRNWKKDCERY